MADEEPKKSGWLGWILGTLAVAVAAVATFIGFNAYQDGTFDKALGRQTRAGRKDDINKGKMIGLAVHNYHSTTDHFPTNITSPEGKPLLSWRVHLLPYLDQQALYEKFHLDE